MRAPSLFLLVLFGYQQIAESLYCLQCQTFMGHPNCREGLMEPTRCKKPSIGCTTFVGKMSGDDMVIRDCTNKVMEFRCHTQMKGGETFCIKPCYTDGCNDDDLSKNGQRRKDQNTILKKVFGLRV